MKNVSRKATSERDFLPDTVTLMISLAKKVKSVAGLIKERVRDALVQREDVALYTITYFERVTKKDIPASLKTVRERIKTGLEERLTVDSIGFGKPLEHTLKGYRRLGGGAYRIVYRIDPVPKRVLLAAVDHRKNIYDNL